MRLKHVLKFLGISLGRANNHSPKESAPAETPKESDAPFFIKVADRAFDELNVSLSGRISVENAELVRKRLVETVKGQPLKNIVIDLGAVEYFDSSAAAILIEVNRLCSELQNSLKLINVPARIQSFLDLVEFEHFKSAGILQPQPAPPLLVQIGEGALTVRQNVRDIITFIGASVTALLYDLSHPRNLMWDRIWRLIERSGSDAVPIVTILSFLMGAILAFQGALQLRKFGANIFVADLVSLSICLEMGPLLTASDSLRQVGRGLRCAYRNDAGNRRGGRAPGDGHRSHSVPGISQNTSRSVCSPLPDTICRPVRNCGRMYRRCILSGRDPRSVFQSGSQGARIKRCGKRPCQEFRLRH